MTQETVRDAAPEREQAPERNPERTERLYTVGVDTSNYTTSLSLARGQEIVKNVRRVLPVAENERGLRQSDALFLHTKALPELCGELFDGTCGFSPEKLAAVGVSARPRDAEGSYMPCFLAGTAFASAIAGVCGVPMYSFSHQAGHVEAALASSALGAAYDGMFFAFHVSGGTTDLLRCERQKDGGIACTRIGGTTDLNAGQAVDRIGVLLGLRFPCGKALDALSMQSSFRGGNEAGDEAGNEKENIKVSVRIDDDGYFCSLSGLENKVRAMLAAGSLREDAAAFLFAYLGKTLSVLSDALFTRFPAVPQIFAGGVMSNTMIRKKLSRRKNVYFASPALSSDNACGAALLAGLKYKTECQP